jgi:hypothetical protein
MVNAMTLMPREEAERRSTADLLHGLVDEELGAVDGLH